MAQERRLGPSSAQDITTLGVELTTNNERTLTETSDGREIVIEVPYGMAHNLGPFLMCTTPDYEMDVISAHGTDQDFGYGTDPLSFPAYHGPGNRLAGTIFNICCMGMSTTDNYFIITTRGPDDADPTKQPTAAPTEVDGIGQIKYLWNVLVGVVFLEFIIVD